MDEVVCLSLCYPTPMLPTILCLASPSQPSPIIGLCVGFPPVGLRRECVLVSKAARLVTNTPDYCITVTEYSGYLSPDFSLGLL